MTYAGLACCLGLLAFGTANAFTSLVLAPVLRRVLARSERTSGTLFALRWSPTVVSIIFVALFFFPAFLWHEPRQTAETVSPAMLGLTGACVFLLVAGPLRGLLSTLATRRLVSRWEVGATRVVLPGTAVPALAVDEAFPLVALVGIWKPRLFVARQVLARCTRAEIAAIVSHETGHVHHRHNLMRLLLRSCPDVLAFTPFASAVERAWSEASDRDADDYAARGGAGLELASALVRVARLVHSRDPRRVPVTALYEGDDVAIRVRRLLEPNRERSLPWMTERRLRYAVALSLPFLVAGLDVQLLRGIHELTEAVVRLLQ